jgi:hypothetical protein
VFTSAFDPKRTFSESSKAPDNCIGLLGQSKIDMHQRTKLHIHGIAVPTAGVATQTPTFVGFPLGVSLGTYDATLDTTLASSWNPAFTTAHGGTPLGAEAALFAGLAEGEAYLNIHTNVFPGGEIRGFLATPLPATLPLFATSLGAMGLIGWRGKRKAAALSA